jgi:protein TonB
VKAALLFLATILLGACPFVAAAEEKESVFTVFRVLVGAPAVGVAPGSVLMVPGPLVMLGKSPEAEAKDVLDLMGKLKDGYRLGEVSLAASLAKAMSPQTEVEMPAVTGNLGVRVTLLALDQTKATYSVSIAKPGEAPSGAKVVIGRGNRGIVGSRDGEAAPYVFLTIEPLPPVRPLAAELEPREGDLTAPKLVSKVTPVYPEQARQARIDGVVVLECAIGADGVVREMKPVRSEPMGLTEAAMDAVRQWRYEPARNAAGKPMSVVYTVTISFRLDRSSSEKPKSEKPEK